MIEIPCAGTTRPLLLAFLGAPLKTANAAIVAAVSAKLVFHNCFFQACFIERDNIHPHAIIESSLGVARKHLC